MQAVEAAIAGDSSRRIQRVGSVGCHHTVQLLQRVIEALTEAPSDTEVVPGVGLEPNLVRAHALSWLGRGEEAR